jgi:hypothetical protein
MLQDVDLSYRNGMLQTDSTLVVGASGAIKFGAAADTDLYRLSANSLATDGALTVFGSMLVGTNPVTGDSNNPNPSDNGFKAWSFDCANATGSFTPVSGTLYLTAIPVHKPVTVTKLWWGMGAAANTPVSGQNFAGLFNSSGTLLQSVGIDTQVAGSNGPQNATITSTALAVGFYWVGILQNATTPQQLVRSTPAFLSIANANLAAASLRACVNGTSLTAMPASITPASNSQSGAGIFWTAVS